jgi:ribosomal protein S18 acetylase RimI-like enzyme
MFCTVSYRILESTRALRYYVKNMSNIQIVRPDPADALQIRELYKTTWLATYPNQEHGITLADIQENTKNISTPEDVKKFSNYLLTLEQESNRFFRVAKEGDRVVGVCGARDKGSLVHLGSLYILPDSQGKGIGSMLMQELLEWTGPDKTLTLHVATYNKTALSFYEKWGFEDTGKRLTEDRFRMASGNSLPELEMVRKAEGQI